MTCLFDNRWLGDNGIGRFAREVSSRVPHLNLNLRGSPTSPLDSFLNMQLSSKNGDWIFSPGMSAPLISRVPYILTLHDINHIDRSDNGGFLKHIYYHTILRHLCLRASAILTVSNFSRDRIIDWFGLSPHKVYNVGNGISEIFSTSTECFQTDYQYILSVSNRRGHKNETRLLEAFSLSKTITSCKLIITGNSTPLIQSIINDLGISSRVIFAGRVTELQLASLYRGATSLIFPSLYEGFGLPIIEAFASGTPVITSNVTSMPEIAGDAALLIDPLDVISIANAIDRLTYDVSLRQLLIERGLARSLFYTWDNVVRNIKNVVDTLESNFPGNFNWH